MFSVVELGQKLNVVAVRNYYSLSRLKKEENLTDLEIEKKFLEKGHYFKVGNLFILKSTVDERI